jgi:hypothetical protein
MVDFAIMRSGMAELEVCKLAVLVVPGSNLAEEIVYSLSSWTLSH